MKATFIKTLALSLLAVVTLGLSACKGDDTPNVPPLLPLHLEKSLESLSS